MLLNLYGGAVLKSEIDFSSWTRRKGIKKEIQTEENYKIKKFLYQFIYIANNIGIEYAEKWIDHYKKDKYRQEVYVRMVKNKPKLAYCHLKSSNGQCRMDCPFWNRECQISSAEEQQSRDLLEEYKPFERKY